MASASVLDTFLDLLDRHIENQTSSDQATGDAAAPAAGEGEGEGKPARSDPASRLKALRGLAASTSASTATAGPAIPPIPATAALTPLERALFHEVEPRRRQLEARKRDIDFWEHYFRARPSSPSSAHAGSSKLTDDQLDERIRTSKEKLKQLQRADLLRREISASIENGLTVTSVLANTAPTSSARRSKVDTDNRNAQGPATEAQHAASSLTYSTTRQLLDDRDDKALEFLRIFDELNRVRDQRFEIKADILKTREETSNLLAEIKSTRSELTLKQIKTQSQPQSGPINSQSSGSTEEAGTAARIRKAQAELVETKAKKEMIKGVLRGLILESGRDWTRSKATRELMLSLEDEEDDSEDEFVDDDEQEAGDDDAEDGEDDES